MIIDFELWAKVYEEDYNSPIKYIDDNGNIKEEKAPNFETILQKIAKMRKAAEKSRFFHQRIS